MTKTRLICENKSSSEKRKSWQQKMRGTGEEGGGRKGGEGEGKREKETEKKRERWRERERGKRREREEEGGKEAEEEREEERWKKGSPVPYLLLIAALVVLRHI